jgi:hypothetical protein
MEGMKYGYARVSTDEAFSECVRAINRFPYEGQESKSARA